MPARSFRTSIGGLMILIACTAFILAFVPLPVFIAVGIPLALFVVAILWLGRACPMPMTRAAAWVCAAYLVLPFLFFTLT